MSSASFYDYPMYQSFVHPTICGQLIKAGLTNVTPFFWKRSPGSEMRLFTLAFDEDMYYRNGEVFIMEFNGHMAAFQGKDMEKLIPDYELVKVNDHYVLSCSQWFVGVSVTDTRMPDVFAKMILKALAENKVDAWRASERINSVGQTK